MILAVVILFLLSHWVAFMIGRRLGAKEGIDYCFDKLEQDLSKKEKP